MAERYGRLRPLTPGLMGGKTSPATLSARALRARRATAPKLAYKNPQGEGAPTAKPPEATRITWGTNGPPQSQCRTPRPCTRAGGYPPLAQPPIVVTVYITTSGGPMDRKKPGDMQRPRASRQDRGPVPKTRSVRMAQARTRALRRQAPNPPSASGGHEALRPRSDAEARPTDARE